MKRLISCRFNMDTACVECDIEGYHPRHTGASVDGLRISVAQPTGQMIGGLSCHATFLYRVYTYS